MSGELSGVFPASPEVIRRAVGSIAGPVANVSPLAGDASSRRFYRVEMARGGSLIAMALTGALDSEDDPQLVVGSYLEQIGFPVPRRIGHDPASGVIAYEDLGDTLLEDLARSDDSARPIGRAAEGPAAPADSRAHAAAPGSGGSRSIESLYSQAVQLLARLQGPGTADLPATHPSARVALDRDRFAFELNFFRENYIERYRQLTFSPAETRDLSDLLDRIAAEASAPPFVLCHRDYHSRNLLVTPAGIRVVDFQDARLGPIAYDLASLLRDSYVELSRELRERLVDEFLSCSPLTLNARSFRNRFDWVALQRNLKAIGTFANQATVHGRDRYLSSIPLTWTYVFDELERLPEISGAAPLLGRVSGRVS